jgi:glycosyltransferase involved in cell wall biosynthesis
MKDPTMLSRQSKIGVFFSHPNQHHSVMFSRLSDYADVQVKIYYFDSNTGQHDRDFSSSQQWDIDYLAGTDYTILKNVFRNRQYSQIKQFNAGVVPAMWRERFDAVFVSGYVIPSNWLVLLLAKLTGAQVLYQSDTNILDEQRKSVHWLKRQARQTFLRGVDTFLVAGDKNQQFYLSVGVRQEKMIWCPIPIDVERFSAAQRDPQAEAVCAGLRAQYDIPAEAKVLVFSGKLIDRKRPQDFIEAVRKLDREDVYGLVLGSGPLEQALRNELSPGDRIRLAGFVNQSMMPYHILLGDIGVVTSEWDPHPLVTTEFAACGLPVVASHFCGVWGEHDILRPEENGFVYTCGHVDELVGYVTRLLHDDTLRQSMGRRGMELAQEQSAQYAAEVIMRHVSALRAGHGSPAKNPVW